jgi:hypothetical protein
MPMILRLSMDIMNSLAGILAWGDMTALSEGKKQLQEFELF